MKKVRQLTTCHPAQHKAIKALFAEASSRGKTIASVAKESGMDPAQIGKWKNKHVPSISNIEAALNTVGLKLEVVPVIVDETPCLGDYYLVGF